MTAYQIKDIKNFMNVFLAAELFDDFYLEQGTITMGVTYQMNGRIVEEFYTQEELELQDRCQSEFAAWKDLRPVCMQLIKGKKTPVSFQFTLHAPDNLIQEMNDSMIQAYLVNIKFEKGVLRCITGVSYSGFSMDKSAEQLWDQQFGKFLQKCQFQTEKL